MSQEYLEKNLPPFLQEGIDDLMDGRRLNLEMRIDLLYSDLQSSINIAYHGNMIDENQANYLRHKYLYQMEV